MVQLFVIKASLDAKGMIFRSPRIPGGLEIRLDVFVFRLSSAKG